MFALLVLGAAVGNVTGAFPEDFFFGVALAPAQAEDQLEDQWLAFAKAGHVHAMDVPAAEDRLRFWTSPEVEVDLAAQTNSEVLRLGVDWGRLFPEPGRLDEAALDRYEEIVKLVRSKGLKVMMTLFHHSEPAWAYALGGWPSKDILPHFEQFAKVVADRLGKYVDFWTTFNEPHVFVGFTYCVGMWPPGPETSSLQQAACMAPHGSFHQAMRHMATAHNTFASYCKEAGYPGKLGVAHNVAHEVPLTWYDDPVVRTLQHLTKFPFMDMVVDHIDFVGLNYYGREILHGASPQILDNVEYSESGRAVDPTGLYQTLKLFWDRYSAKVPSIIITENGISDATDVLRPSYLIEHLLAIRQAIQDGIKVDGYVHWTTSDNWEWVDGYCPKFGLAAVDRANELKRQPRDSFHLYATIAKSKAVTAQQREDAWAAVVAAQESSATRPFCRGIDGKSSLDQPVQRPFAKTDWRFTLPKSPKTEMQYV